MTGRGESFIVAELIRAKRIYNPRVGGSSPTPLPSELLLRSARATSEYAAG